MRTDMVVALSLSMVSCGNLSGQKFETCPTITGDELSLNREKDGQHVYANVGQRIVICLQTIGGVTTAHRRYLPKQSDSTEQSLQKGRTREVPRRFTISLQLLRERTKSAYPTPIQTPLLRL